MRAWSEKCNIYRRGDLRTTLLLDGGSNFSVRGLNLPVSVVSSVLRRHGIGRGFVLRRSATLLANRWEGNQNSANAYGHCKGSNRTKSASRSARGGRLPVEDKADAALTGPSESPGKFERANGSIPSVRRIGGHKRPYWQNRPAKARKQTAFLDVRQNDMASARAVRPRAALRQKVAARGSGPEMGSPSPIVTGGHIDLPYRINASLLSSALRSSLDRGKEFNCPGQVFCSIRSTSGIELCAFEWSTPQGGWLIGSCLHIDQVESAYIT